MKRFLVHGLIFSVPILVCINTYAFTSSLKQINRPYHCHGLTLKGARKSLRNMQNEYRFAGICSVKDQNKKKQELWLEVVASWGQKSHVAKEWIEISGIGSGEIEVSMKCTDDPWISDAYCEIDEIINTSTYPGFSNIFSIKQGGLGAPSSQLSYPPIARGVMTASEIKNFLMSPDSDIAPPPPPPKPLPRLSRAELKLLKFKPNQSKADEDGKTEIKLPPKPASPKLATKSKKPIQLGKKFDYPTYKGYQVDYCYRWGQDCGKPAADAWCRQLGFSQSDRWRIAHDVGNTLVMGDGRFCRRYSCDSFNMISCIN